MHPMVKVLKQLVDKNGLDYLTEQPQAVYRALVQSPDVKAPEARALVSTLFANTPSVAADSDTSTLGSFLERECLLAPAAAQQLAALYLELMSPEHQAQWDAMEEQGFRDFCEGEWQSILEMEETWSYSTGYLECNGKCEALWKVEDVSVARKWAQPLLDRNPFSPEDAFFETVDRKLAEAIQDQFDRHVHAEAYYEPDVEEFDCEGYMEDICAKYGLKLVECEYKGWDSGFIPNDYCW